MTDQKRAVILLSGGLDSATLVAMVRAEGYSCYTMSFDYGQRHRAELEAAARVARDLGVVEHKVIGLNLDGMGGSALTAAKPEQGRYREGWRRTRCQLLADSFLLSGRR